MARFLSVMLLASILAGIVPAHAQEAADNSLAHQLKAHLKALEARPDIARALSRRATPTDPTGEFIYLEAQVDERRAPAGAYPPPGVAIEHIGFGGPPCYPIVRLRVPAARVEEVRALLRTMAPQVTKF